MLFKHDIENLALIPIVKIRLRNKIENEFLSDNLTVYIEKEVTENFIFDSILDDSRSLKECRLQF